MGGKRRKLEVTRKQSVFLDNAAHIATLLEGARRLDARAKSNGQIPRYELLATLVFAGPRVSELIACDVRDLDLAAGRLRLYESKDVHVGAAASAGVRYVDRLPVLRDVLGAYKARMGERPADDPLSPSSASTRQDRNRVRTRILHAAIREANTIMAEQEGSPLPEGRTVHSLRHTFVSILLALGKDLPYVMQQAGHDEEGTTLRIYAKVMRYSDDDRAATRAR